MADCRAVRSQELHPEYFCLEMIQLIRQNWGAQILSMLLKLGQGQERWREESLMRSLNACR